MKDRISYWATVDRLGPDIPWTHWRLYFKSTMITLCRNRFKTFSEGAEFRPGAYAICCSNINIGKRVIIRPETMLFADPRDQGAGITLEDDVMLGAGVHIYVANHRFDDANMPIIEQGHYPSTPVVLKYGCWIGARCIILPGVTIGENAVVGAGSVVTKSIPPRMVAVGNPARVIRKIDMDNETRNEN
ncbi:acyltransferase [Methylicorpusculum sp.]|uniref:acyltransferase n=1 Tax=Methylicorpusculum sp. TaxID=2713644 RepID=UPI002ABC4433|nr:acyltransferase [Methylicorpusculum sp.]MDZ4150151.1 acyltransferase [Methylicorpusculum sp.]